MQPCLRQRSGEAADAYVFEMAQGVRVSREEIVGENQHPQVGELLEHRVWYLGDLVESGRTTTTTTTRTLCHSQKQKARRWMVRAPQVDMVQKWLGRPAAVARKGLEQLCSGERTTSIRTEAIQEIRRERKRRARVPSGYLEKLQLLRTTFLVSNGSGGMICVASSCDIRRYGSR